MDNFDILRTLKFLPGIILGLTIHEFSHAYVAQRCGDSTSKDQGRVTLNPFKHIDLLGFIMLLAVGFGWAKPVEFNEENLRNPKIDVLKIAIAGPVSNALLAIVLSLIFVLVYNFLPVDSYSGRAYIIEIFYYAITINWGLFIFNLIPLPPLDGSHLVFNHFKKYPDFYVKLYRYGSLALFGLLIASVVLKVNLLPIWPLAEFFERGFLSILGFSF